MIFFAREYFQTQLTFRVTFTRVFRLQRVIHSILSTRIVLHVREADRLQLNTPSDLVTSTIRYGPTGDEALPHSI